MPAAINDSLWAKMTPAQKCEAVRAGRATLRQLAAGALDGPTELERVCLQVLARTDASCQQLPVNPERSTDPTELETSEPQQRAEASQSQNSSDTSRESERPVARRQRLGLPIGYLLRLRRHEKLARAGAAGSSLPGAKTDQET